MSRKRKRKAPTAARARQRNAAAASRIRDERKRRMKVMLPVIALASLAVIAGAVYGIYRLWRLAQPKFHDVTVELGTGSLGIEDFMTEYAESSRARFVTDPGTLDIGRLGETEVTLSHGGREETVILRVEDTTPPTVEFIEKLERTAGYEPKPEDFVEIIEDESRTEVFFENEPDLSDPYSDIDVTVVVRDEAGLEDSRKCRVTRNWLLPAKTLELGEKLTREDLLLDPEYGGKLISDEELEQINSQGVGTTSFAAEAGGKQAECVITIQDTTPPEVVFETEISHPGHTVPDPEVFVKSVSDHSDTRIYYEDAPESLDGDEDVALTVVVEDAYGNKTSAKCGITRGWIRSAYTLEIGQKLTAADLLLDSAYGEEYISQEELDAINGSPVGTYVVHSRSGSREIDCRVNVVDTVAPTLVLRDRRIYQGKTIGLWDFVQTASDAAGNVSVSFVKEPPYKQLGTHTVSIEARDVNGNTTVKQATLSVVADTDPPAISGLTNMSVKKYSTPDFMSGVSAWDANDGSVTVTYDASKVDLYTYGTYYITYTAKDKAGNTATARRQIYVQPDSGDTSRIVQNIAAQLPADVETLRDYCRKNITYRNDSAADWGGDDPVNMGFVNHVGNCYVHARCFKALLDEKGIENRLIWTTDKTHYWNLVNINGVWRHMDSTPGTMHSKYSIMTDSMRYETLIRYGRQRDWDRSNPDWPKCE